MVSRQTVLQYYFQDITDINHNVVLNFYTQNAPVMGAFCVYIATTFI
jgi:hypothetical protein